MKKIMISMYKKFDQFILVKPNSIEMIDFIVSNIYICSIKYLKIKHQSDKKVTKMMKRHLISIQQN